MIEQSKHEQLLLQLEEAVSEFENHGGIMTSEQRAEALVNLGFLGFGVDQVGQHHPDKDKIKTATDALMVRCEFAAEAMNERDAISKLLPTVVRERMRSLRI